MADAGEFVVHQDPVWRERSNFIINAELRTAVAVLAAVLAYVLPAANASAERASAAGNAVGAHHSGMILSVGVSRAVCAGGGRSEAGLRALIVSGACVAAEEAAEEAGADAGDTVGRSCGLSFAAGTKVLLASGAAISISQLKVGDKVLATNTRTGKTKAETVAAVLLNHDTDLYDLTIKTAKGSAVIDTTRNHPFFDVTRHRWVKAGALKHGGHLRTSNGVTATVVGGHSPADTTGWMWDLTVPGGNDHDFYIDTIVGAVLVHNCGEEDSIDPRDVHGALRGAERDVNPEDLESSR